MTPETRSYLAEREVSNRDACALKVATFVDPKDPTRQEVVSKYDQNGNPVYGGCVRLERAKLAELLRHAAGQSNLKTPASAAWGEVANQIRATFARDAVGYAPLFPYVALRAANKLISGEVVNG